MYKKFDKLSIMKNDLITIFEIYARVRRFKHSTLGKKIALAPDFHARLKVGRVSIRKAEEVMLKLSEIWPEEVPWPKDIPRPKPQNKDAA
ncbi:MAG: hypothetical protein J4F41_00055 [Alphaproteobacteria bacterium]|nr:hypothetical protein [Alphaproteobacteria bacterium]